MVASLRFRQGIELYAQKLDRFDLRIHLRVLTTQMQRKSFLKRCALRNSIGDFAQKKKHAVRILLVLNDLTRHRVAFEPILFVYWSKSVCRCSVCPAHSQGWKTERLAESVRERSGTTRPKSQVPRIDQPLEAEEMAPSFG